MNKKFQESKFSKYIHWNVASWMGLLGIVMSVAAVSFIMINLAGGSEPTVGLTVLQFLLMAVSLFLFVDATFLRKNASYIAESTLVVLLVLAYVIVEIAYAFQTMDSTLATIENHPELYSSAAAKQTAILTAKNLCRDQCIFYFISLPFIVGTGAMGIIKMLNGETRVVNYAMFGLAIFFVFIGSYQYANILDMLANFNNVALSQIVETRSPAIYIVVAGVTSFFSDYDPAKDEKLLPREDKVTA